MQQKVEEVLDRIIRVGYNMDTLDIKADRRNCNEIDSILFNEPNI
jgi:hypothetical protein